jgi:hypothetical protein
VPSGPLLGAGYRCVISFKHGHSLLSPAGRYGGECETEAPDCQEI